MTTQPRRPGPLPAPEHKERYVRDMFNRIARRYDRMNRLMTLGRDRAWRRAAVGEVLRGLPGARRLLDVATGTGDLALEALRQAPALQVAGVDFALPMLAEAQRKGQAAGGGPGLAAGEARRKVQAAGGGLGLAAGDALRLPFPDASFDAVVTGFAMRNVTSIPAAFAEMARVTRPGGRVACLEIARPRLPLFRQAFALYFYRLVPRLGVWLGGEAQAYTYLPHSLTRFLAPPELAEVMRAAGWRDVRYRRLMLGTVALHVGTREAGTRPALPSSRE